MKQTSLASMVTAVEITGRMASGGPAFGIAAENGEAIYVPAVLAELFGMATGQSYEMHVIPNTVAPEKTPWFAKYVVAKLDSVSTALAQQLCEAMARGGVWTTERAADLVGVPPDRAFFLLESIYTSGACSKFLLFNAPNTQPVNQWYTMAPEAADVDEFEED